MAGERHPFTYFAEEKPEAQGGKAACPGHKAREKPVPPGGWGSMQVEKAVGVHPTLASPCLFQPRDHPPAPGKEFRPQISLRGSRQAEGLALSLCAGQNGRVNQINRDAGEMPLL